MPRRSVLAAAGLSLAATGAASAAGPVVELPAVRTWEERS
jgi:hypothetical protein